MSAFANGERGRYGTSLSDALSRRERAGVRALKRRETDQEEAR
jgi:hypothetical protein